MVDLEDDEEELNAALTDFIHSLLEANGFDPENSRYTLMLDIAGSTYLIVGSPDIGGKIVKIFTEEWFCESCACLAFDSPLDILISIESEL